jgi:DNA-binding transcriptional MerR regulator
MNAQPAQPYLGIGEVLAQLRAEFPDIRVSKIRFLESEGLIAPARSPSGYRRFGPADVEQLRYILTTQRDQYLPLRVIRERLARPPATARRATGPGTAPGTGPGTAPGRGDAEAGPAAAAAQRRGALLSRRELLDAAGIDDSQLSELETYGLVRRVGRQYGQDALDVAVTVAALASYGVEARHLRAVRAAVERETSLIEQVVAPTLRQRNLQARELAGRTAREIAALLLPLHRALIEAALAEAGLPGRALAEHDAAGPRPREAARGPRPQEAAGGPRDAASGPRGRAAAPDQEASA